MLCKDVMCESCMAPGVWSCKLSLCIEGAPVRNKALVLVRAVRGYMHFSECTVHASWHSGLMSMIWYRNESGGIS